MGPLPLVLFEIYKSDVSIVTLAYQHIYFRLVLASIDNNGNIETKSAVCRINFTLRRSPLSAHNKKYVPNAAYKCVT